MITTRKCKYCFHCENIGRADAKYAAACCHNGRKYYYCMHPDAHQRFIGYGDTTEQSPIQIKTHPKWCPLEKE